MANTGVTLFNAWSVGLIGVQLVALLLFTKVQLLTEYRVAPLTAGQVNGLGTAVPVKLGVGVVKVTGDHWANKVVLFVMLKVSLGEKAVPDPFAAVFHPLNEKAVRDNGPEFVFTVTVEPET